MERDNKVTSMDTEVKAMEEQLTKLREENDEVCETKHSSRSFTEQRLTCRSSQVVRQRDALRDQLSDSVAKTSVVLKRMADRQVRQICTHCP